MEPDRIMRRLSVAAVARHLGCYRTITRTNCFVPPPTGRVTVLVVIGPAAVAVIGKPADCSGDLVVRSGDVSKL